MAKLNPPTDPTKAPKAEAPKAQPSPAKPAAPKKAPAKTAAKSRAPAGMPMSNEVPDVAGATVATEKAPKLGASPPFYFRFHPERWTVLGEQVVPLLGKLKLQGGLNRVQHKGGKIHAREAQAHSEEQGWITIPFDVQGPGTNYLRRVPETDMWVSQFERVFPGSGEIRSDEPGYLAFLKMLVDDGHVPRPELHVLERLEERAAQDWGVAADKARNVPSYGAFAEVLAKNLAAIRAVLEERRRELAPAEVVADAPELADDAAAGGAS